MLAGKARVDSILLLHLSNRAGPLSTGGSHRWGSSSETGFYRFYARDFNFRDGVVSIREGRELTKVEKEWTTKHNTRKDRFWWCIEDPFELTHNLGRVADRDSLFCMRGEFMRAAKLLDKGASFDTEV